MNKPRGALRPRAVIRTRDRLLAVTGESERTVLLGTILLGSAVLAAIGFVLAEYYSVDVLALLAVFPDDCWANWGAKIGRHCFSDYAMLVGSGMRPTQMGLIAYVFALAISVLSPAVWAARDARGLTAW